MASEPAFQRARRPEQKQVRATAILDAARSLALRDGVRAVSLGALAACVGIHKSALLRYFGTREEIFLELTAQAWHDWAAALHAALDDAPTGAADLVADQLAATLAERPLFCDLLAHTALNLERNGSLDAVRRYKLTVLAVLDDLAALVGRRLPELPPAACADLLGALCALAGAVSQTANPPPVLRALYEQDPALRAARVEVAPVLRRAARVFVAGLRVVDG